MFSSIFLFMYLLLFIFVLLYYYFGFYSMIYNENSILVIYEDKREVT